jgi:hypothetical protein
MNWTKLANITIPLFFLFLYVMNENCMMQMYRMSEDHFSLLTKILLRWQHISTSHTIISSNLEQIILFFFYNFDMLKCDFLMSLKCWCKENFIHIPWLYALLRTLASFITCPFLSQLVLTSVLIYTVCLKSNLTKIVSLLFRYTMYVV